MEKTNDKKTSRASQTREKTSQKKVWSPPSALDAPPAPTGFRHRWIRAESVGFDDTKNISGKLRSGWELVRADEYENSEYPSCQRRKIRWSDWVVAYCWLGYRKSSRSNVTNTSKTTEAT